MCRKRFVFVLLLPIVPVAGNAQDAWHLFRGNAQRTSSAANLPLWNKRPAWQRPLLMDKLDSDRNGDPDDDAKALIAKLQKVADANLLPGSFPLIVQDQCIYRSHRDIRSVAMQNVKVVGANEAFTPGEIVWKGLEQNRALAFVLEKPGLAPATQRLLAALRASNQDPWMFANPMPGALSSDGTTIFSINDLVFPKSEVKLLQGGLGDLKPFFLENELIAYDVATGKMVWDTGEHPFRKSPFSKTHFLGVPTAIGGKLYVLNEKDGDLRLLRIDADAKKWANDNLPDVEKALSIAKVPPAEQVLQSPLRRTQPLHVAVKDDLLICPTHVGEIVGVDRVKMAIRWTYRYRDANVAVLTQPHWQAACPMIAKERIVFTTADAAEIHCIDFDGAKKWTAKDANGMYLATVHDDIVLTVGKGMCRALKLADGTEKWKLEMGLPAGVGVKDGSLYYLPLRRDAETEKPALWAMDLVKGTKVRRIEVPHPEALGNLALHRGLFVSQSVTHVAAFPLPVKKAP